ncbi:MAG: DUF1801 domain-containing protein [Thiothrix sp.]|nr:MAG: DUF1801 domain-containing protein [Thiothrix sp.]
MDGFIDQEVLAVFNKYPKSMQIKLMFLRQLILDTALEESVNDVKETLKWGEPSYVAKSGSTIRLGWKKSRPDHYALYFHCKTKLIDTFKELYGDTFRYEGSRAIVFSKDDEVPVSELTHCIFLALTYHQRKHLPLLGA